MFFSFSNHLAALPNQASIVQAGSVWDPDPTLTNLPQLVTVTSLNIEQLQISPTKPDYIPTLLLLCRQLECPSTEVEK